MSGLVEVLAFALLPFAGFLIGSVLAEGVRSRDWAVGAALHAAAGIAIALVSIDLMPQILRTIDLASMAVAFSAGALASVLLAHGVRRLQSARGGMRQARALMVFAAVGADLASDGLMTGAGAAVGEQLGFLLAASQSVANIPGAFAAMANLREQSISRTMRLVLMAAMALPALASAAIGYLALADAGPFAKNLTLAFIVGVLLLATVEDVIPEGDAPRPKRTVSSVAFTGGFVMFAMVSLALTK